MKVAIITTYADKVLTSRFELIMSLLKRGHTITIIGAEAEDICKKELGKYNINYVRLPFNRSNINPFNEIKFISNSVNILKQLKLEALIVFGVRLSASIAIAGKKAKIKKVYAIINGAGTLFNMTGIKGKLILALSYPLLFSGLRLNNKVFFQNVDNKKIFSQLHLVKKDKAILVNGSGVNLEKFRPKPMSSSKTFLFIGRLIRDKGVIEFLEAAKKVKKIYPNSKFLIIGPYDENVTAISKKDLDLMIENNLIEHIPWTDNVSQYMKECFVFVLPSYHEGIPRTVIEAMATARPIITTDAPGCRETVIDGLNGFLVPIKDSRVLSEKMIWMLENRKIVEKMGIESLRLVTDKFDVHNINKLMLENMEL